MDEIRIAPLRTDEGAVIIPEYWLEQTARQRMLSDPTNGNVYQRFDQYPTVAELLNAYFNSTEFQDAEKKSELRREATSTCLENGRTVIVSPHTIVFDRYAEPKPFGRYIASGGKRSELQVTEDGYVLEVDYYTGLPIEVTKRMEASKEAFGVPIKFDCFSNVNHEGALMVATVYLKFEPDPVIYIFLKNQPSSVSGQSKARRCRRAQFDQAAYETFAKEHAAFAPFFDGSMTLEQSKETFRANSDLKRRYDEHMAVWRLLRSELE